ncbi:hypothetical protein PVK06_027230 [Gossypium arboreum]|uniref:Uncharacterized protein n=1 Tax=Gossypium arboreum TaxID=29729 RepID=A0ABR0NZQ6_GOSAR|nr:hypothetical protein PVK06_027230 [Gossypium arboreum]
MNLERIGVKLVKVAEITSEEQCNSLAIVVYTRPLQVDSLTKIAADDAGAKPGTKEQSVDRAKPKEKKKLPELIKNSILVAFTKPNLIT